MKNQNAFTNHVGVTTTPEGVIGLPSTLLVLSGFRFFLSTISSLFISGQHPSILPLLVDYMFSKRDHPYIYDLCIVACFNSGYGVWTERTAIIKYRALTSSILHIETLYWHPQENSRPIPKSIPCLHLAETGEESYAKKPYARERFDPRNSM